MSGRSRLLSASLWSISGNGAQYAVVFFLMVYMARILEPRDFGLMATVSVGLDLGTRIARWGQVELLQQKRWQSDEARNQSLRFSLGIAVVCCALFIALAEPVAAYYHSEELRLMIYLCAPVFLFSATGSTAEAVLRSSYKFKVLAFRSTVATLIGAATAILFATMGYGALALAVQRIVQAAVSGLWVWTAVDWRPSFKLNIPWSKGLMSEGASVMAGTLMPVAVPRSIDLLVGFFMGPATLGLMRVAFRVNDFAGQMVVMPLVSVANADLSAKTHDDVAMCKAYLRLTQASALLMSPILIGLSLVAAEAIPFIFGPHWKGSVPFVQIIGLLGIIAPLNYYFAPAMVALGRSRLILRQGVAQIVLGIGLTLVAAQFSLVAIAISHVVRAVIICVVNIFELRRYMRLSPVDLAKSMVPPVVGTFGMAAAVIGARMTGIEALPAFPRLVLLTGIGALTYGLCLALVMAAGLWPDSRELLARLLGRVRREPVLR
jgi:O-antigen/teichoic acid export membrane protein